MIVTETVTQFPRTTASEPVATPPGQIQQPENAPRILPQFIAALERIFARKMITGSVLLLLSLVLHSALLPFLPDSSLSFLLLASVVFLASPPMWNWFLFTFRAHLNVNPLPPGPFTWPILGSIASIDAREPQKSVLEWRKQFGNVYTIALPVNTVVVCGYEEIKKAAIMTEASARPVSYLYTIFLHNEEGNGMILSSGKTWKRARNFAIKHFDSFGVRSEAIMRRIEFHADKMIDVIEQTIEKEGEVINLHKAVSFTVASIIYEIVLGRRYDISDESMWYLKDLLDGVLANVQGVQMLIADNNPWLQNILPADRMYRKLGFELQDFFLRELALNRKMLEEENNNNKEQSEIDPHNLMTKYLEDPNALENGDMDVVLLAGDIWTGGMETTLTATRWAIIFFMQNPDVQEKLHEEIVQRYPRRSTGEFSYSSRDELPYLCAVIDEVLRLANVLPWNIPHRACKTFSLNGHSITEGTYIMFSYSALHHDEANFPDPYKFNPERFLRRSPTEEEKKEWMWRGKKIDDFVVYEKNPLLCPFGMGLRKCPGETLAMKEICVFLIKLVQRFRFVTDALCPPDTTRCMGMTSVPREFVCRVQKREDWYSA